MPSITGRTVTKQLKIETRQHELLGYDLGEGPRRRDLMLGLVIVPVWIGLMVLILGPPNKYTSLLYMAPPVLFLMYGIQENARNPRRMNITQWILTLRRGFTGHRPVIRGGARLARRAEYMPVSRRWPLRSIAVTLGAPNLVDHNGEVQWREVSQLAGLGWTRRYIDKEERDHTAPVGPPIRLAPITYLYSTDALVSVASREAAKKNARKARKKAHR